MGGHEPIEPRPSVGSYRQKFMNLGLGLSRHRPIVAGCREGYILKGTPGKIKKFGERRGGVWNSAGWEASMPQF